MNRPAVLLVIVLLVLVPLVADAADERVVTERDLGALVWRPIGPTNMGGRATAIALVPGSRTEFYVGYATGGLFKTTNLGTTFSEVFRRHETCSIGAVGVAHAPADWPGWEAMAAAGYRVTAFDLSESAIAMCRARFPESTVDYRVDDLFAPPSDWRRGFDLVYECNTIQILGGELREKALRAIVELVAPGGVALVSCRSCEVGEQGGVLPIPLDRVEIGALAEIAFSFRMSADIAIEAILFCSDKLR